MAKSCTSGDRDWMEGVRDIFASLLWLLLSCLQQIASPRGRGDPGNYGRWNDIDDALSRPSASDDWRISPNIDPEGQYNARPVDQLPAVRDPIQNIEVDNDNADADETDLNIWLTVAEVASLPRQIERDEANMMVRRPRVSSSVAESGVAPSSLVNNVAAGGILPQQIEDEDEAHAAAEVEVAMETFPPGMLQLISGVASLPQFAAASMALPAGDLESNLEEGMPVDHPEARDSSADLQAEAFIQDDVENLPPQHLPPQSPVPETAAADARAPDVGGILAGVLPQRIEDEVEAQAQAQAQAQMETDVAIETFPPGMLELISDGAKLPQVATASMSGPAGGLESNLEERMPVDHPEAGDLQAKINMEDIDDVENLGVEEPHAEGMQ